MSSDDRSFWQAVTAFLVMPGVVGFLVPFLLRPARPVRLAALPVLVVGCATLLWCVRDFYVAGRGTLAPWSPPRSLVTVGLYRWSRNPMYVGVVVLLCGWALAYGSTALWLYAAAVAIAFHLRVVLGEEPWLARKYGDAWRAYSARVPRWVGRPRRAGQRGRATAG